MITEYLDALVAHSPERLPLSSTIRFTEDSVELKPGEGFWATAAKPRSRRPDVVPYRLDVLDPEQGTAVVFAVLAENDSAVLHVARLKVVDREVAELETTVVRSQADGGGIFDPMPLQHPSDTMTRVPAPGQLASRNDAIKMAEYYPAGLRAGSFNTVDAPFAPSAYRLENGRIMAGPGCTFAEGCGNIKTQSMRAYPARYRVIAVDESLGIVVLRQNFGPRPNDARIDLHTWHALKIYDGQIHAVEVFQKVLPTGTRWGWDD